MGPPSSRKVGSKGKGTKLHKQGTRSKFEARHIDQVWNDIRKNPAEVIGSIVGPKGTTDKAEHDDDVPGRGQFYCIPCARYFQNAVALADHDKTKPHKRRVKTLMTSAKPHSQRDADAAGGMGAPDNGQPLVAPMQS